MEKITSLILSPATADFQCRLTGRFSPSHLLTRLSRDDDQNSSTSFPQSTTMDSPSVPPRSPTSVPIAASGDKDEGCCSSPIPVNDWEMHPVDESLLAEVLFLRASFQSLEVMYEESEAHLAVLRRERDEAVEKYVGRSKMVEDLERERDRLLALVAAARETEEHRKRQVVEGEREMENLEREIYEGLREREEFSRKIESGARERDGLSKEVEGFRLRVWELDEDRREMDRMLLKCSDLVAGIRDSLWEICEIFYEDKGGSNVGGDHAETMQEPYSNSNLSDHSDGSRDSASDLLLARLNSVSKLVARVGEKFNDYRQRSKKEKKELENSVVSLTEENRDINSLLRIALVEKEAVEKSLNKLKGTTAVSDQKRVALLQIAERGLQRVGFGFMMGTAGGEPAVSDAASSTASNVSDCSECDEEFVSLASTVDKIMKNLRLEITQLRKALEESRSDIERLQSLTEKQSKQIAEQTAYIKELEDGETLLTQNVEELLLEIKSVEEEVARWREACELEVEAGKTIVEERDKVAAILKQELEKTRSALEISESKLKLKEELASAAMAAQEAAEKSLQLVDSRASELRYRIEELTKQSEEAESREKNTRRVRRRICWPWRALKANSIANGIVSASDGGNRINSMRRFLPEMQALLQYSA